MSARRPVLSFLYPRGLSGRKRACGWRASLHTSSSGAVAVSRRQPEGTLGGKGVGYGQSQQAAPRGRASRSRRDDTDGTMTLREKELFGRIFQSILETKPSLQDDPTKRTISFEQSSSPGSTHSGQLENPAASMGRDYIEQYPRSIQREALLAQRALKTKSDRVEANRARTSNKYRAAKEELYGYKDIPAVIEFLEQHLFGPFLRKEVVLKQMTPETIEFCRAYPLLLADVMCILRLSFKDLSASRSVFAKMKEIGIESSAIGGSTAVYNELVLTVFEGWRDLGMVEDVLKEMEEDAIQADDQTVVILKHIRATIVGEREASLAGHLYWSSTRPTLLENLNRRINGFDRALGSYVD